MLLEFVLIPCLNTAQDHDLWILSTNTIHTHRHTQPHKTLVVKAKQTHSSLEI